MERACRLLSCAMLLGACEARAPAPVLREVEPGSGPNDVRVELEIRGTFRLEASTDFEGPSSGTLEQSFQARLVWGEAGESIGLEDVQLVGEGTLRAAVPAGVPEQRYGLEVTDSRGRLGSLPDAYRALAPAQAVTRLLVAPIVAQRSGVPFTVRASAVDSTGRVVTGYDAEARLSDETGTLVADAAPRFSGGRLVAEVTLAAASAADTVYVEDAAGRSARSAAFEVAPGLPAALRLARAPASLAPGQCSEPFEVHLEDREGRAPDPSAAATVRLGADRAQLGFYDDASCRHPVAQAPLSPEGVATFRVLAPRSGTFALRLVAAPVPALERTVVVAPAAAAGLGFVTPTQVIRVGECSAAVRLASLGSDGLPAPVEGTVPVRVAASEALELFEDGSCLVPLGPLSLGPEEAARGLFVSARAEGLFVLGAEAAGLGVATETFVAVP